MPGFQNRKAVWRPFLAAMLLLPLQNLPLSRLFQIPGQHHRKLLIPKRQHHRGFIHIRVGFRPIRMQAG